MKLVNKHIEKDGSVSIPARPAMHDGRHLGPSQYIHERSITAVVSMMLLFILTTSGRSAELSQVNAQTLNVQGYVTLRPEDDEDMYHIYNLISPGDQVRALAVRRVQTTSSTGSSDSYRVRVQLQLAVTKTDFSQAASGSAAGPGGGTGGGGGGLASNGTSNDKRGEGTASLQISGQVVNENEYVRLGAFHTLDLEGESTFVPTTDLVCIK